MVKSLTSERGQNNFITLCLLQPKHGSNLNIGYFFILFMFDRGQNKNKNPLNFECIFLPFFMLDFRSIFFHWVHELNIKLFYFFYVLVYCFIYLKGKKRRRIKSARWFSIHFYVICGSGQSGNFSLAVVAFFGLSCFVH